MTRFRALINQCVTLCSTIRGSLVWRKCCFSEASTIWLDLLKAIWNLSALKKETHPFSLRGRVMICWQLYGLFSALLCLTASCLSLELEKRILFLQYGIMMARVLLICCSPVQLHRQTLCKLPASAASHVICYEEILTGPATGWRPVHGLPRFSPYGTWDGSNNVLFFSTGSYSLFLTYVSPAKVKKRTIYFISVTFSELFSEVQKMWAIVSFVLF